MRVLASIISCLFRRRVPADARKDRPAARHAGVGARQEEAVVSDVEEQAEHVGTANHGERSAVEVQFHPGFLERRGSRIPEDGVGIVGIDDHAIDPPRQHDATAGGFLGTALGGMPAVGHRGGPVDRVLIEFVVRRDLEVLRKRTVRRRDHALCGDHGVTLDARPLRDHEPASHEKARRTGAPGNRSPVQWMRAA